MSEQAARPPGRVRLTRPQWQVLEILWEQGPTMTRSLGERGLGGSVNALLRRSLVTVSKEPGEPERVTLTPRGRRRVEEQVRIV